MTTAPTSKPELSGSITAATEHPSKASLWSQIKPLLGHSRGTLVILVFGSVFSGLAESVILAVLAQSASALVEGVVRIHTDLGPVRVNTTLGVLLTIACALALIRLGMQGVVSYAPARIASDLRARLSAELFAAFTRASWDMQSRDREGQLQELATSQVINAAAGALMAATLIVGIVSFLVLVVSALTLNILAAIVVLVAAAGLSVLLRPLSTLGKHRSDAASRAALNYAAGINESVRVAEETQVFGVAASQRDRITQLVGAVRTPYFHTHLLGILVPALYQGLIYLLVAAALTSLYLTGAGHIASLGAVVLLLVRAGSYGQQAQGSYQMLRQALPFVERVQRARQRYLASMSGNGKRPLRRVRTMLFENVSFHYRPGVPVLSDISFEISDGEAVGIVGPTGAGKSTLVQILLRLRTPRIGRYLINGSPASEFNANDWHARIAYLPQEPRLMHASVADNIRFFRKLDDRDVEHAAMVAGIHERISSWTDGYATIIGPRADAVSGGEQQRICLARALAARPEVLILDEPTSALDPHTERLIQESFVNLKERLTLIVIAHRMSTIDICERVMVIVDGRLQGFDDAETLRTSSAYFRSASELAASGSLVEPTPPHHTHAGRRTVK